MRARSGALGALGLLWIAALGCDDDGGTPDYAARVSGHRVPASDLTSKDLGDGPVGLATALTNRAQLHALEDDLIRAFCEISHGCCGEWGYLMVFGCERAAYDFLYRDKVPLPDDQHSYYIFNDLYAERCLSLVQDMVGQCRFDAWQYVYTMDACRAVVQPIRPFGLFSDQTLPTTPIECGGVLWSCPGLHERWDMTCIDYRCQEPTYVARGEACDVSANTANGIYSNEGTLRVCQVEDYCVEGVCVPRGGDGAPCEDFGDCQLGLYCSADDTCEPRLGLGEDCAIGGRPCYDGLHCSAQTGFCTENSPSLGGDPCDTIDDCPVLVRDARFDYPFDLAVTCEEGRCGGDGLRFVLCGDSDVVFAR